jgi:hypothetical protein
MEAGSALLHAQLALFPTLLVYWLPAPQYRWANVPPEVVPQATTHALKKA